MYAGEPLHGKRGRKGLNPTDKCGSAMRSSSLKFEHPLCESRSHSFAETNSKGVGTSRGAEGEGVLTNEEDHRRAMLVERWNALRRAIRAST